MGTAQVRVKSKVIFVSGGLKMLFERLEKSDPRLFKWISGAIAKLEKNPFCGRHVKRKLVPGEYVAKFGIDNLWKLNLPGGWRMMYSVEKDEIGIVSIILEWLPHKKYERRFGY